MHLALLFLFFSCVNALHFYLDANQKRCFIEELPTDTVVEGNFRTIPSGRPLRDLPLRTLPWA